MDSTSAPLLFNAWKHHAGFLRARIREAASRGDAGLHALSENINVIGADLMDLYVGELSPPEIAHRIIEHLSGIGKLVRDNYRSWIDGQGGFAVVELAEDRSRWVLRHGNDAARFIHVHPGRWSPCTRRVRANVLKTAVSVLAHFAVHGGDPKNLDLINAVRCQLGLAPLKKLDKDAGLAGVLDCLGLP